MSKLVTSIGLMSGTSLDGIDVALIRTDGEGTVQRWASQTFTYSDEQRSVLRSALQDAVSITDRRDRPGAVRTAELLLTEAHAKAVQVFTKKTGMTAAQIDIVGFHGQTVLHRPEQRLTVQIGDGEALARGLGLPVAWDMRAADVAAGGQGAPLVPVYHRALASKLPKPVAFVNIGGVSNLTFIGADDELIAFDTGPGNALIDDWMLQHTGRAVDENGSAASRGQVDESVVAQFLGNSFFERPGPKSLDRNSFASLSFTGLSLEDGAATLAAVTAQSIAAARRHLPSEPQEWIICGGGRKNKAIMKKLGELLPKVRTAENLSFNGDSMEAEAWAYLAVRCLKGLPLTFPGTTGVAEEMTGGEISKP